MNDIQIDIQIASNSTDLPPKTKFRTWAKSALQNVSKAEITIRIVDEEESASLNKNFRNKSGSTNVLSFPFKHPYSSNTLLGDIVICAPLVTKEALSQRKDKLAHWAHLTVHGLLHLQGYDHVEDEDAQQMESLETSILQQLGFPDPHKW